VSLRLATALLACAAGGENRLWFVDLELCGACEEVRLECGSDGVTRLLGPFASGEDRRASVPVPVRSPLGAAGLSSVPLPSARVSPAGSPATVRVLGWSAEQPAANLERRAGALLAGPRPPVAPVAPRAAWPELVLVLIAGGVLLRFRRRFPVTLVLGLGAGAMALALARSRALGVQQGQPVRLLEWEAGGALALTVSVARDELALPREWLEVVPEGLALEIEWRDPGGGRVRARPARLAGVASAAIPPLAPGANAGEPLEAVWTRTSGGVWRARGPWPPGTPLGQEAPEASDPPGWLASALPPGRSVLLGRTAAGEWLRCLGFEAE
jgi:hypothetical protein